MDPSFYNNSAAGAYNASHRPASSNQHLNQNNPNSPNLNNAQSVPVPPSMSAGQAAVAGGSAAIAAPGMSAANYATYNPQGTANNNAQYRMAAAAVAAGGRPLPTQPHVYGGTQQQSAPLQQQQHVRSAVASPPAVAAAVGYGVPNPLGIGGAGPAAPAAAGVGVASVAAPPPTGPSKTDLLRSMYQSRQRQQPAPQQQPQQPVQQQPQQSVQAQGIQAAQGMQQSTYRSPVMQPQQQPQGIPQPQGIQQRTANTAAYAAGVPNTQQPQSAGYRQQQGVIAAPPQQNYQQQQQQRSASQMASHAQIIQQQQQGRQMASQSMQHAPPQQQQQQVQQRQQVSQQVNQQAYAQQQQSNRLNVQQQQYTQQQAQQQQQQAQQQQQQRASQQTQQARPPSTQAAPQQPPTSQQQSQPQPAQKQHRFHLTPEAKVTLREAVLSAIRHPTGEVDPGCLQRAMAQGLPKQAILNAAVVARQRDRRNREERRVALQQRQQQQAAQQQSVARQGQQQPGVPHPGQQGVARQVAVQPPQQPTASQGTVVHHPGMPRTAAPPYPPPNAATSAKAQIQQMLSTQPTAQQQQYSQTTAQQQQQQYNPTPQQQLTPQQQQQYNQTAQQQQQSRIYQQQQQQQAQQRQQQLQQQAQMTRVRQLQAQQVNIAQQRKMAEEARKKQLELQYQQEQQRRAQQAKAAQLAQQRRAQAAAQEQQRRLLEQKRKKEMEIKAAAEAQAKRNAVLVSKMKPWGRTGFALVVKRCAKGLPLPSQQQQQPPPGGVPSKQNAAIMSRAILRQSTWGGTSMCSDGESALVGALKRGSKEPSANDMAPENVQKAVDLIRKRLLLQTPPPKDDSKLPPPTADEIRHKRLTAISAKLLPQPDILKRHKLQPKRESKFLDKHIRRARQMTADAHSKRHKELLKAIVSHQSEFYKFHRGKRSDALKLARQIRDQLKKAEAAKEKEADHAEKARLNALRSNDMAAYTSLLEDTKNERLKFLLDKTDECMNQISTLLASRVAEEEEEIKLMGGEDTMKATFTENVTGGSYYETAHVKSEQVRQPSILTGGDLKEYQLGGLQWLVSLYNNRLNGILADEMGLGKTIQTIALLAYLIEVKQNLGPYLVIVPLSTLSNWVNEFAKWLPAATVVCYKGTPQQRKQLFRDEVADGHFNVLLTTYEFVIRDKGSLKKLAWQYAIVDEGHRMKNNESKFAVTLSKDYNTRRRVLLTGTPLQNNLPELWALLNFLLPAIFNSAETFDQWFNKPFESFGKSASAGDAEGDSDELLSNEERMLIIHRLHELLRPFMLRRVKSEVLDQLPTKVEKVIRCELSSWQKELYKQISHKVAGEAATKNFNRGLNNVVMQLRKVCNHPYLFSQDGYHINEDVIRTSGKVELLDRMLPKLKAAGHRILMFTQMTKMMPILEDYFAYRGFSSLRLDGSTTADEREKRMYMFNAPDSPYFVFLLSTRAGGLGLNLATADTVIIFDSDWNPMMDLQAQDRAHRIGQRRDVRVFRIITQTPVEEKILSRATEKLQMNELVVEAGKFDKSGQGKESNSLERLKMMELLLTDFDQNQNNQGTATSEEDFEKDDDGEEEANKNLLNEMISTNDEDYKLYCQMDLDRIDAPALYNDVNDCPDWIRYPNGKPESGDEFLDDGEPELLGKRRAAAGNKMYDDGLTEQQFCRMMDKQATAEENGKKKRKKKRNRNAVDPSLILENDGGGRKRSKTKHLELEDTSSRSKAGGAASSASSVAVSGNGEITAAMYDRLISVTRSIIYFKEKGTKRKLSEIFLEKPCPQTYSDYYQIVDKPVGMNDILRKCRAKLYSSVNDFRDDWNTLFKNALTYNGEGSWIVNDAEALKVELDRLMDKNALSASAAASKKPIRLKLSLKKGKTKKETKSGGGDGNENDTPPPAAAMKKSESQSELDEGDDSGDESDSTTEGNSDIVGMEEREASLSKRGKIRSGGLGSRGGTTRLVRRSG